MLLLSVLMDKFEVVIELDDLPLKVIRVDKFRSRKHLSIGDPHPQTQLIVATTTKLSKPISKVNNKLGFLFYSIYLLINILGFAWI